MSEPTGCSSALVTLPMRVKAFSFIWDKVSIEGDLICFLPVSPACVATGFPFFAAMYLPEAIVAERGGGGECLSSEGFKRR